MENIDLKKVLRSKIGDRARFVPRFAVNMLERFLCVDKMNHVIRNFWSHQPREFIGESLDYIGVKYKVYGSEKLSNIESSISFVANHPLGGLDGLVLAHALMPEVGGDVRLVVNDLLMHISPLSPLFLPINKHGSQNSDYARTINESFQTNKAIIIFPAGLCSRYHKGRVQDLEWKTNFIRKSFETQRVVVPIYVKGLNSRFFYILSKLRRKLKINFNIEMLFLPREMFAQKGRIIDIYIGDPVMSEKYSNDGLHSTTKYLRDQVYGFEQSVGR